MDRVFESGAAASPPAAPASPSTGYATAGNPSTGTPPTKPGPWWYHMITEELRAVIAAVGLTPSHSDTGQLQSAINKARVEQIGTAYTSAGTAPNFTLTPSPAITAYAAKQRFRVNFHAAGAGADQLNVSGLGNKALKQYDDTGAKVAAIIAAGQLADVEYDGVDMVVLDPLPNVATAVSDPTFANNSSKAASTSWVRGAMLAIATAAGFAISTAENGYIKLPSWLGGLVIQWGVLSAAANTTTALTYPIAFPTAARVALALSLDTTGATYRVNALSLSTTGMSVVSTYATSALTVNWLAIGY